MSSDFSIKIRFKAEVGVGGLGEGGGQHSDAALIKRIITGEIGWTLLSAALIFNAALLYILQRKKCADLKA